MAMPSIELVALAVLLIIFSAVSLWKKALDLKGVIVALIVGILTYFFGGASAFIALIVFFIVGEFATRLARSRYKKEHETRSIGNILGNALAPLIALIAGWNFGFFAGVSAALADTLSSEIGLLSKSKPRMITTLKEVEPGIDGGVTLLGLIASFAGAIIIGIVFWIVGPWPNGIIDPMLIGIIIVAGFLGSIIDSLLGATLQKRKLLDNNSVNFMAITVTIIIAMIMVSLYIIWLFSNSFSL
ncbi:MAG: DUF92 domain-containing protein [archaeon]|nr:DUF92 domain-containing protein [archaeon]